MQKYLYFIPGTILKGKLEIEKIMCITLKNDIGGELLRLSLIQIS